MTSPFLITGSSGNVGREVVKLLSARGVPVRAAVRATGKRGGGSSLPAVEEMAFDFERPETFGSALAGVRGLFLMRPPHLADIERQMGPAIEAARTAGVEHVVFLSIYGVNPLVPHWRVEKLVRRSGMGFTFLRASFFMQNLDTTHREEIRTRNELFIPAGKGKTSFIDVRDIAAVAVEALLHPGHYRNRSLSLTGSESLDYDELARIFSEVLGRQIRYPRPSPRAFRERMVAAGQAADYVDVVANIYRVVRWHLAGGRSAEVERILGRPPIRMEQYVRDYAECWR